VDIAFGVNGFADISVGEQTWVYDIALAPDGGILVAGWAVPTYTAGLLCKLLPTGALDPAFGNAGVVTFYGGGADIAQFYALISEPGGRIVVAGVIGESDADAVFLRFEADGTLDITFGVDGVARCNEFDGLDQLTSLAALPDGGYLGAGIMITPTGQVFGLLAGVDAQGTFDPDLGTNGTVLPELPNDSIVEISGVAVDGDAFYITGGATEDPAEQPDLFVAKFNLDGTLATDYGDNGATLIDLNTYEVARGITVQNGRVVICGWSGEYTPDFSAIPDFTIVRLNEAGTLDPTFGESFGYTVSEINGLGTYAFDLALLPDGRIVVAGGYGQAGELGTAVARYLADGQFAAVEDATGPNGARLFPQPSSDGRFQLSTDDPIIPGTPWVIFDAQGREVLTLRSVRRDIRGTVMIDAHTLAPGSYRLRVGTERRSWPLMIVR
jgi:uncharacterized delta-60 repeat protein